MPMVVEQQVQIETGDQPVEITAVALLPCESVADVRFAAVQLWEAARPEDRPRLTNATAMRWRDTLTADTWHTILPGVLNEFIARWDDLAAKEAEMT